MKQTKLLWIGALVCASALSQACSVCIAHAIGAGLHALGAQTLHKGATIVGISYSDFSKSNAGELAGTTESHDQHEWSVEVAHGLSPQLMLRASVPYVTKKLSMTGDPSITTRGLGDITVGLTYQFKPKPDQKVLWGATADLKLPTGNNDIKDSTGTRRDEHAQIGTGSTDVSLGVLATSDTKTGGICFAGLRGRWNGKNKQHYHYGDAVFYNLGYSHPLGDKQSVVLELNGRIAAKDTTDTGEKDDNSGGHFGYASLSYRRSLGENTGLVVSYQLPVIKKLNGTQSESRLLSVGVSIAR